MRTNRFPAVALAAAAVLAAGAVRQARAQDDGPGRGVARISLINGDVSIRRGDSGDWVAATVNAPLVTQDRLTTGPGARAELQFDYANFLRIGADSEVRMSELEYRRYLIQVARGTVNFRVLRNSEAYVEVSTPAVSVRPQKTGMYRVTVREDGQAEISVRSGEVEVYTPRGMERLKAGRMMLVRGTATDPEYQIVNAGDDDEWDRWNERRDRTLERSSAYRYVPHDIYGAEDLDPYGRWVWMPPYGYVWSPAVASGWAPYRQGRWSWVDWYGWTWVSYDPWGWAPYHYGRWFHSAPYGWCWYPGGFARHYWRPALVAFFGFGVGSLHVGFGFGHVGWVPLAPYEPYYAWYGHRYYGGYRNSVYIDRSVHITNNVNIVNVYRNARVVNAVSGVEAGSFANGGIRRYSPVQNGQIREAGLVKGQLPVGPTEASLRVSDREVRGIPRTSEGGRFFSREKPVPVERVSFAEQRRSFEAANRAGGGAPVVGAAPAPAENRSWRRGGEAATSGGTPPAGAQAESTPRTGGAGTRSGWRQFGEPPAAAGAGAPAAIPRTGEAVRTGTGDRGRGEWRRFGDAPQAPATAGAPRPQESGRGNWQRFSETPAPAAPATRSGEPTPMRRSQDGNRGWGRFGDPGAALPSTVPNPSRGTFRDAAPQPIERNPGRMEGGFGGRSSRPQSIQIAPPVVHERSGGGGGGGGSVRHGGGDGGARSSSGGGGRSDGGGRSSGSGGHSGRR